MVETINHQVILNPFFCFEIHPSMPPTPPGLHVVIPHYKGKAVTCAGIQGHLGVVAVDGRTWTIPRQDLVDVAVAGELEPNVLVDRGLRFTRGNIKPKVDQVRCQGRIAGGFKVGIGTDRCAFTHTRGE